MGRIKMEINREKNEIFILLNKHFYNIESISNALEDFKDICCGELSDAGKDYIQIILKLKDKSMIEILGYEFCNYSLGLMKNKLLV
ncbi:HxsD-like protein [Patescibacteria group bacterium]|nr:HxsD-like protein [Patescibacteria group bacterium]